MRFRRGMGSPMAREANIIRYAPIASSFSRSVISFGWGRWRVDANWSAHMVGRAGTLDPMPALLLLLAAEPGVFVCEVAQIEQNTH